LLSTDAAFANSLPERERKKLSLGCSSSKGVWILWTITASDSSPTSDLAVHVILCGTSGSTAPHLLMDELRSAGERGGSFAAERKQTTARRSAALTKPFKPSATDQFVVSD